MKSFSLTSATCTSCADQRGSEPCTLFRRDIYGGHSRISVRAGKTKVWNRSGVFPPACIALQHAAGSVCPTAMVWRGDSHTSRGSRFSVCLSGLQNLCRDSWRTRSQIPDTQSAWLLLSFCAAARANFFLRGVNPDFAAHDHGVWQCFCRILQMSPSCGAQDQSSLPLWEGGLGLRSARRTQPAAHWASWADALKMVKERHPAVADTILRALETDTESSSIQAVLRCTRTLHNAGCESPTWTELAEGHGPTLLRRKSVPVSHASDGRSKRARRSRGTITTSWCGRSWRNLTEP